MFLLIHIVLFLVAPKRLKYNKVCQCLEIGKTEANPWTEARKVWILGGHFQLHWPSRRSWKLEYIFHSLCSKLGRGSMTNASILIHTTQTFNLMLCSLFFARWNRQVSWTFSSILGASQQKELLEGTTYSFIFLETACLPDPSAPKCRLIEGLIHRQQLGKLGH